MILAQTIREPLDRHLELCERPLEDAFVAPIGPKADAHLTAGMAQRDVPVGAGGLYRADSLCPLRWQILAEDAAEP